MSLGMACDKPVHRAGRSAGVRRNYDAAVMFLTLLPA
jgi:hypothetical protein